MDFGGVVDVRDLSVGARKMQVSGFTVAIACVIGVAVLGVVTPVRAADRDGDLVHDLHDVCDNTPAGTAVDTEGRPLGDVDLDCDYDLDDIALSRSAFTGPLVPYAVVIDTVTVGNPGNANDTTGFGSVAYTYNMGRFEVTAGQYAAFLNAVAATDTYALYDAYMWTSDRACKIQRTGSTGSYTYSVAGDWADRPVNFVSWGDAARFANWLHNGQPTGAQDLTTTEDGSYYLNGAMSGTELQAVSREGDATWVIPSEDEWYKAAYHYNDGVTGNYWDYPTKTNTSPTLEAPPGTDLVQGSVNARGGGWLPGGPYYRTEVGAYDAKPSDSPYGTFDQAGNVYEWSEAIEDIYYRVNRGGTFDSGDRTLRADQRNWYYAQGAYDFTGFRVAKVPSP